MSLDGHASPTPTCLRLTRPAVSVLRGDSKVTGTVTFEQDSENAPTKITWDITGNDPNAKRGFHIHTFGDNTNGCTSAGPHCESQMPPKLPRLTAPQSTPITRLTALPPKRPVTSATWVTSRRMPKATPRAA